MPPSLNIFNAPRPAAQPQMDPYTIAEMAAELTHRKMSAAAQAQAQADSVRMKISSAYKSRIVNIAKVSAQIALARAGALKLSEEQAAELEAAAEAAEADAENLADEAADGAISSDQLIDQMADAAASDPNAASQFLQDAAGIEVPPNEIEQAAAALSDASVEEATTGDTKTSSAKGAVAAINRFMTKHSSASPWVAEILQRRADFITNQRYAQNRR